MVSLVGFSLRHAHKRVERLGDRLLAVEKMVDWERFRPLVAGLYDDDPETGGRPHTDEVVLVKCLVLQSWYNLADQELEYQLADRLSFQKFLGFPETIPDYSTIWYCRERLAQSDRLKKIWKELQHQLDANGFGVKKGVIQDASIITADVGKKRQYQEKKAAKEGKATEYSPKQEAHMDHDGSYTVKNGQVGFGYKIHQKCDAKNGFIRSINVSTASLHDSQIDLSNKGDPPMYRDKGYAGIPPRYAKDFTMRKAYRNTPLTRADKLWNKHIAKKRACGERPIAVIKNVFKRGHTLLKNIARVTVQQIFNAFAFNVYNLYTYAKDR
ncbi:IS5 family transposase [archaeon]|nr:IS5 family transposase [archaeon]